MPNANQERSWARKALKQLGLPVTAESVEDVINFHIFELHKGEGTGFSRGLNERARVEAEEATVAHLGADVPDALIGIHGSMRRHLRTPGQRRPNGGK